MSDESPINGEPVQVALTPEEIETKKARLLAALQHQVAMLMDEMKRLFAPNMKLTFIARSADDPTAYSLLTEETDTDILIEFLKNAKAPAPLSRPETSTAVN